MTDAQQAPYTPTLTLNLDDNPVVIFAEHCEDGQWRWAFRVADNIGNDKAKTRQLLLSLNRSCTEWYFRNFVNQPSEKDQ